LEQILRRSFNDNIQRYARYAYILGDTVFYDGHYTVKQNENGQYYLKSHHKHKAVTPFNEDVMLNETIASEVYITTKESI
jgi:hypothetical protein